MIFLRDFSDLFETKYLGRGNYMYIYEIWWNLKIKQLQMTNIDDNIYQNKGHVKTMPKG